MRTKTGIVRKKRHQKVLKRAKGFWMTRGRLYKVSKEADLHAGQYAFAGRKKRKRDLRSLWISRINAALESFNLPYSKFINLLKMGKISLNRKVLADLAVSEPETFQAIVKVVHTGKKNSSAKKTAK